MSMSTLKSSFFRNKAGFPDIKPDTPEQQQWRRETIQRLLKLAKEQAEDRLKDIENNHQIRSN